MFVCVLLMRLSVVNRKSAFVFFVCVCVCVRDRWDRPELISVAPQTASWDLQAAQGQMFVHTVQRKLVVIGDDACGEVDCD